MIEFVLGGFGGVFVTGVVLLVADAITDARVAAADRRQRIADLVADVSYLMGAVERLEEAVDHDGDDIASIESRVDDIDFYLTAVDSVEDEEVEEAE